MSVTQSEIYTEILKFVTQVGLVSVENDAVIILYLLISEM